MFCPFNCYLSSEAKKGTSKKAAKPKRWESFKNTFTLNTRQRSQSPAVETRDHKKTAKKSFMDRFKVKRGGAHQLTDHPTTKRPLSFTGADEKRKDTLDIFAQFEVSKSLPSSPVLKKKKPSVASLETATPVSPTSMTSGSPFTPGGMTTDSQTSTPVHKDTAATTNTSSAQGEGESGLPAVRQEIQVRVDIEDTSAPSPVIPVIVEPSTEVVEIPADAGEPAEPAKLDAVIVESVESPAKQAVAEEKEEGDVVEVPDKVLEAAEPIAAEDKEMESSVNPAELDESIEPTDKDVESPIKPDELVTLDKEPETTEGPTKPIEQAEPSIEKEAKEKPDELVTLDKEAETTEGPTKPIEQAEPSIEKEAKEKEIETVEKEPEGEEINLAAEPGIANEAVEQATMNEEDNKALDETTGHVEVAQEGVEDMMPSEEPAMPVESAAVIGKEVKKKIDKKPVLPAKPAVVTDVETKRKDEKAIKPAKPAAVPEKEVEKTEEALVPKYLKDRHFQWDKIREILATAPESTDISSYSELPPQDVSWMDHLSPAEQLRAFLLVCP